jgi:hypothetical protein
MEAEEPTNIGICPHCTNYIFKDAVFNSEGRFSTRCPHCSKALKVIIKRKIEIIVLPAVQELKKKGPGIVAVILLLNLPSLVQGFIDIAG